MKSASLRLCAILPLSLGIGALDIVSAEQDREQAPVVPTLDWHSDPAEAYAESEATGRPVLLVFR